MARVVLVADDSPSVQKIAIGILKGEGFDVETVSNGVAAIKRLAVLHPVAILADVSMPGRDGYEVCEFVKKSAEFSHVPVLLVASDMEPYDSVRGMEVGADGIIKKPFEAHELISVVVKFAEQFEAETPTVITSSAPSAVPELTIPEASPEFVISGNALEDAASEVRPAIPDFSSVPDGVAFTDPTVETVPEGTAESQNAEIDRGYSFPQTETEISPEPAPEPEFIEAVSASESLGESVEETPLPPEQPPTPDSLAPPFPVPSLTEIPSGIEGATPEPQLSAEQDSPTPEFPGPAAEPTTDFSAPIETDEPAWKYETMLPPATEPASDTAMQPQLEDERPVVSSEFPVESYPEQPSIGPAVTVTNLDDFSLDDATAGQVQFNSQPLEATPLEVAQPVPPQAERETEVDPPEPVPEAALMERSHAEAPAEPAPPEPSPAPAVPLPAFDWGLISSVVHKVVARMSPPLLPAEIVEDMARQLTNEITAEITSGSLPPNP